MSKPFRVEKAATLWPALTFGGLVLTLLSAIWVMNLDESVLGAWSFYSMIIGFIVFVYGGLEFHRYGKRVQTLKKLLELNSKSSVLKNLDEMEYLAWVLPSGWGELVKAKKKDFRIR